MDKLIYKGYKELAEDIAKNIYKVSEENFELVVGIPRSGMIPAYMLSSYLNIDCIDLDGFINNVPLQHGITRKTKYNLSYPHNANMILLVDDSIFSGESMKSAISKIPVSLRDKTIPLAVYGTKNSDSTGTISLEIIKGKKLFEWGIFHNSLISKTCFDMDGVLCEDLELKQDYRHSDYIQAIKTVKKKFHPTGKIHSIVTNRKEEYRSETITWLNNNDISFDNLIMLSCKDRNKIDPSIDHKAKYYRASKDCLLFIESNNSQAEKICIHSGKPVFCTDTSRFFSPNSLSKIVYDKNGLLKSTWNYMKHRLKMIFINS